MESAKIFKGTMTVIIAENIPINTSHKYVVEFDAKSIGEIDSKAYFFIQCLD